MNGDCIKAKYTETNWEREILLEVKRVLCLVALILSDKHSVVTLVWLQGELFPRLKLHSLQLVDFGGEHSFGRRCGVDTAGLDGDQAVTLVLQEGFGVVSDDTCLIWLSNVREDDVHCSDEHAVFVRVTSIFNNRDDICAFLGHVDQITAGSVRELNSVHDSFRSNNIGNV